MRKTWFHILLLSGLCLHFLWPSLFVSSIFAFILGMKYEDTTVPLKSFLLGVALGIESALLISLTTSFSGFSRMLALTRTFGITIDSHIIYSSVFFLAIIYIIIFEAMYVMLVARIGMFIGRLLADKHVHIIW